MLSIREIFRRKQPPASREEFCLDTTKALVPKSIEGISGGFEHLLGDMGGLTNDLGHQRNATHAINCSVQTSAEAARDLNRVVDQLFALVSENNMMSGHLLENSKKLQTEADLLQHEVRAFSATAVSSNVGF